MIPDIYKAAMEGRTESLDDYDMHQIESERTHNKNTVVHVAAQFGQLDYVTNILERCFSLSLLEELNLQQETALHMAAREGKLDIVEALTSHAKNVGSIYQALALLRATNLYGDTALHMAVRNEHLDIVSFLASEDRVYSYPPNITEETPLYLAVESNNMAMVVAILQDCPLRDYSGPDGRTALHEAALIKDRAIATTLLQWKPELVGKLDGRGWTPLHYAAWCGNEGGVLEVILETMILNRQPLEIFSTELIPFDEGQNGELDTPGWTPLQVAAAKGHVSVMEKILSAYPEWWDIVDSRGDNILHIAVQHEREEVINFIDQKWKSLLMNQKNNDGNMPLHFLAASKLKAKEGSSSLRNRRGYWRTFNNKNLSPADIGEMFQVEDELECRYGSARNTASISDEHDKLKKIEEELKAMEDEEQQKANDIEEQRVKTAQSLVIVSSLLATVTFAAAFAIPGGYDPNPGSEQGMPILARKAAFKAFVITNSIAVISSIASVYFIVTSMTARGIDTRGLRFYFGTRLLRYAIVATTIAFMTGTYSMLPPNWGLAILGCVMGSVFIYCVIEDFFFPDSLPKIVELLVLLPC